MDNKMEIDSESNETDQKTGVELYKLGGHSLVSCKPLFSSDGKQIVLSSDASIRVYSLETGSYLFDHQLQHNHPIIAIQTNGENNDEIITTSKHGFVVFWHSIETRILDEIQLKLSEDESIVTNHYVNNYFYFVVLTPIGTQLCYCTKNMPQKRMPLNTENKFFNPLANSVAFGPLNNVKYLAQIIRNCLHIFEIPIRNRVERIRHMTSAEHELTCVAFHPNDNIIATGNTLGRIYVWFNDFFDNNHPTKSVLHWHQLPVTDICFSPEGTYLYSVGEEMCLLRWNILGNLIGEKNVLPRIGTPIKYVTCDREHKYLLTSHVDNSISVISSAMTGIYSSIDELSLGVGRNGALSSGLSWNSKLKAVVLNGRTGYLQFYSPELQKQLFQLDIVGQNIVSREVGQVLYYTDVSKVAVSENGDWLSSIEIRDDKETLPEIRLKFWLLTDNSFSLNTTIHLPHKCEVNSIQFAPNSAQLISTSLDKCFKIWILCKETDKLLWKCSVMGNLNNTTVPRITDWSFDSSTIAVAFDFTIALWDVSVEGKIEIISTLPEQSDNNYDIDFIKFGGIDKSNYLVVCRHSRLDNSFIRLWNLLDLSVIWTYSRPFRLDSYSLNRSHNILALSFDNEVCFLQLEHQKIICSVYIASNDGNMKQKIIASLFSEDICSNDCKQIDFSSHENLSHLKFYCLNEKQEFFSLRLFNKSTKQVIITTKVIQSECDQNISPLALMLMKKRESNENLNFNDVNNYLQPNINTSKLVEEMLFNVPSHALPPIQVLGELFLSALLKCQSNKINENKLNTELEPKSPITYPNAKSEDIINDDKISNDEESEINVKEEVSDVVINEDYSWLNRLSTEWNEL